MKQGLFIILLISVAATKGIAQDSLYVVPGDTLITEAADTVLIKSYAARYDPRKALLFAAIVPGLGQIYNKKYWKLPLVYGGFIAIGYGINAYQGYYNKYKLLLFRNLEEGIAENSTYPDDDYTTAAYRRAVDLNKRQRDFMLILMGGMYLLQIVDAHVDAHLKEFDLNPKLQVSVRPTVEQSALLGNQSGISLIIKF